VPEQQDLHCPLHGECLPEPSALLFPSSGEHDRRTARRVEGRLYSNNRAADYAELVIFT